MIGKTEKKSFITRTLDVLLKGEPSKKWEGEGLLESIQNNTFDNFKSKAIELVEVIMGKDIHKSQIKNLMDIPQPTNLTTAEWCDRVAVINTGLVYLTKGAKAMMDEEVIEKVIS
jgi:hypothetical protein